MKLRIGMKLRTGLFVPVGLLVPLAGAFGEDKPKADEAASVPKLVKVKMVTSLGDIVLELNGEKAPITVKNFLHYVEDKFYDGTIFHRVMGNFMIQGGGFTEDLQQKKTKPPIKNEAKNGLKNKAGTIAMARTNMPHSATAQFFINVVDNKFLDYPSRDGWGYCVFGKVVKGMEVVEKIRKAKTQQQGARFQNLPSEPIVIRSIRLIEDEKKPEKPAEKE